MTSARMAHKQGRPPSTVKDVGKPVNDATSQLNLADHAEPDVAQRARL